MTESIEYNSIVEFIEKTIKANQVGGLKKTNKQTLTVDQQSPTQPPTQPPIQPLTPTQPVIDDEKTIKLKLAGDLDKIIESQVNPKPGENPGQGMFEEIVDATVKDGINTTVTDFLKDVKLSPWTKGVLISSLTAIFLYYWKSKDNDTKKREIILNIMAATIFCILIGEKKNRDYIIDQIQILFTFTKSSNNNLYGGSGSSAIDYKTILITALATTVVVGSLALIFASYDSEMTLYENFTKFIGNQKVSQVSDKGSLRFDRSTGRVVVNGTVQKTKITMNSSQHFGITGIEIEIEGNIVKYLVNGVELDSISYIEHKPIATALYLAYLVQNKKSNVPSNTSFKSDSEFKYRFEDDGSLTLTNREGKVVDTISVAIRNQLSGNEEAANANITAVCKKLFQVDGGRTDPTCAKHFYSILGKSALAMLQNIGTKVNDESIFQALKNADVGIKYEILKNLDWKMKISNGKKEMVDVNQWVERLEQDKRDGVKVAAKEYREYLNSAGAGAKVKDILEHMVFDINNNTRLLDEKYQEAVQQQEELGPRKRRSRLNPNQVANLRAQTINENSILNTPFAMPGSPGVLIYPSNHNPYKIGGFDNNYKKTFEGIKSSLNNYNQKLSSETEKRINKKINDIGILEGELNKIQEQINEYTKILREEKYPVFNGNVISLSDIEDLIHQYQSNSKKQIKEIVTLTTAFGKIKMSLERQDPNEHESKKNLLFNL